MNTVPFCKKDDIMKKRIICVLVLSILLFITTSCAVSRAEQKSSIEQADAGVAAVVNGETIFLKNIEAAYAQQSMDLQNPYARIQDKREILNNTIRELVVIQYGKSQGVFLSDQDNSQFIENLKEYMPEAYERGIAAYGEEEYHNGLRMRQLFTFSKKDIMERLEKEITISMNEVNAYVAEHGITNQLTDKKVEVIRIQLMEKKLQDNYKIFVDSLVEQAEIEIFI